MFEDKEQRPVVGGLWESFPSFLAFLPTLHRDEFITMENMAASCRLGSRSKKLAESFIFNYKHNWKSGEGRLLISKLAP